MDNSKGFEFFNIIAELTEKSKIEIIKNKKVEIRAKLSGLRDKICGAAEEGKTSIYLRINDAKLNNFILEDIDVLKELMYEEIGYGFSISPYDDEHLDKYLISWKHGITNKIKGES